MLNCLNVKLQGGYASVGTGYLPVRQRSRFIFPALISQKSSFSQLSNNAMFG